MGTTLTFQDWLALTQLYADYASAVDSGHWDLWPEFFTEQCVYRLQPRDLHDRSYCQKAGSPTPPSFAGRPR